MTAMAKNDVVYAPCDGVIISLRKGQKVEVEEFANDQFWLTINDNCRIRVDQGNLDTNYFMF